MTTQNCSIPLRTIFPVSLMDRNGIAIECLLAYLAQKKRRGVDESIDSLKLLHFLGGYLNFTIPKGTP